MAQVKIFGLRQSLERDRTAISQAIHASVMKAFEYPPDKKFHRFIMLAEADFVYPADRSNRYTIIEIDPRCLVRASCGAVHEFAPAVLRGARGLSAAASGLSAAAPLAAGG